MPNARTAFMRIAATVGLLHFIAMPLLCCGMACCSAQHSVAASASARYYCIPAASFILLLVIALLFICLIRITPLNFGGSSLGNKWWSQK
jgi:hypothetical protein